MVTDEVARHLSYLNEDYASKAGERFAHFYCPIMHRDEEVELCMGHVIPESLQNCSRLQVVQRKDVDNFYGRFAEADFGTMVEARGKGVGAVVFDPSLNKRMRPRIVLNGQEIKYYAFKGHKDPSHSRLIIASEQDGTEADLVVAKSHDEMLASDPKGWGFCVQRDFRIASIATLIKAAYLTMFHLHGYRWAISAAGLEVGHGMLGKFFCENRGKALNEVREAAKIFFSPYKHMVRPMERLVGVQPMKGTLEDNRAGLCFGITGRIFGLVVFVRIDARFHAVLLPAAEDGDSAAEYWKFINDQRETLFITGCWFDDREKKWIVDPDSIEAVWPKQGDTFTIE